MPQKSDELWESYAAEDKFYAKVYDNLKEFTEMYSSVSDQIQPDMPVLLQYGK